MKVLLIGPLPPPHGGISVHVASLSKQLTAAGVQNEVLDLSRVTNWFAYAFKLIRYARRGWTPHFQANGHNWKSWMLALSSGICGRLGQGSILTLHSGMAPAYLTTCSPWSRALATMVCRLHSRTICASPEIMHAVLSLGISPHRVEVVPARIETLLRADILDPELTSWMDHHAPLLSTTLFFRPEYGFETLVLAMKLLRKRYPSAGCVVLGSGEQRCAAEQLLREHGLAGSILLAGDVDHNTCLNVFAGSNVFVRPTFADGDSVSVREALSLGVPVVASSVGIRPAGTILFEAGDVDSLVAGIERALAAPLCQPVRSESCIERLLASYRFAAASRRDLCPDRR